ncbi:MAG: hypothetical protein FWH20_01865 [Oscillospiraceae bacterium]|nr:hypothetical protein [Oscillospiraceae bacterium]
MIDYKKSDCPVCNKDFKDEKPVVCPDCGAPYHRDCWALTGKCSFEDVHGNGFSWAMPMVNPQKQANSDSSATSDNPANPDNPDIPQEIHTAILEAAQKSLDNLKAMQDSLFGDKTKTTFEGRFFDKPDETAKPPPEERLIFGVSEKEINFFQGNPDPFRFMKYRKIAAGQKISLNIFAALLSPFYFFYTRMRAAGILAAIVIFLLRLPVLFGGTESLGKIGVLFTLLGYGFQVVLALYFDYFYLLWMVYRIKMIRYEFLADEMFQQLFDENPNGNVEDFVETVVEELDDRLSETFENTFFNDGSPFDPSHLGEDYYAALQSAGKPGLLSVVEGVAITFLMLLATQLVITVT